MTKTELESKHLSDLHQLAAAAGVERYRMLTRAELIERLSDGDDGGDAPRAGVDGGEDRGERRPRRRRRSGSGGREREARVDVEDEEEETPPPRRERAKKSAAPTSRDAEAAEKDAEAADKDSDDDEEGSRPKRRPRRRRRFGRRRDGLSIQDLLLPPESGRQTVLLAETREAATELLRGVAGDLASGSDGPDPVALLIDPSPEELADWKREAPQAEIVSAGQARHASDALSTAQRRAAEGEDVILLVDSLTRFTESFGDTDAAKALFDAGRGKAASGKGSLTVVVALERN
ncbi:MAG TPA: Rho termination factor N-terminal domain-containing protein [Solirubrobacterales bacterium]|nr:Rho termination factor N-terminal domain-containing protein [Solirubrobacterales bacterium]